MKLVRIIGIGSTSGDDRIGWDAIWAIEASGLLERFPGGAVEACCCDRPSSLIGMFKDADAVIIIDAMRAGGAVGMVRRLEAYELATECGFLSSHGISVAETIALGAALGLLPRTLVIYGVEAQDAAPATEPGPDACAAIPLVLDAVAAELERLYSFRVSRNAGEVPATRAGKVPL